MTEVPELAGFTAPVPFTREAIRDAPRSRGVHVVLDPAGAVVYVGETGDLRTRMQEHLGGDREASVLHAQVGETLDTDTDTADAAAVRAWLAQCLVAWREVDDSASLKAELVAALQPRFNRRGTRTRTGVWWVNQRRSYEFERAAWIVFAGSGGAQVAHHSDVSRMRVDDVVLHHRRGSVVAIGVVLVEAVTARRPYGPPAERDDGWLTRVEYFPLDSPIPVGELPPRSGTEGPFARTGDAKQGYLFPLDLRYADSVREGFADRWPVGSPWRSEDRRYWLRVADGDSWQVGSGFAAIPTGDAFTGLVPNGDHGIRAGDGIAVVDTATRLYALARAVPRGHPDARESVEYVLHHHVPPPYPTLNAARAAVPAAVEPMTSDDWRAAVAVTPVHPRGERQGQWDAIVRWASRFAATVDLDAQERSYKLVLRDRLVAAADAVAADREDWPRLLRRAFAAPNNLTSFYAHGKLLDWADAHGADARAALLALWRQETPVADAMDEFAASIPAGMLTPGVLVNVASYLAGARGIEQHPAYRARMFEAAYRLTGWPADAKRRPGLRYTDALEFVDAFAEACRGAGVPLRDRLDAQGLLWQVLAGNAPPSWTAAERDAYARFLEGGAVNEIAELVEQFRDETDYPGGVRAARDAEREELAAALTAEALEEPDVPALRRLAGPAYGSPGSQPGWNRLLQTDEGIAEVSAALRHLLYGPGDVVERLDAWIAGDRKLRGVGEAMAVKALAVREPGRWIPCYVTNGKVGKAHILDLLEAGPVDAATPGAAAAATNDRIRALVQPHLGDDPWGIQEFTWWLMHRTAVPDVSVTHVAEELYLTDEFLTRILRLLDDKGQVVFYGPPGTGKTYAARRLADHIARGGGTVEKVQFHPAYAYEDFVEGYRPKLVNGQVSYELVNGPLKRIAADARKRPDVTHVLLVDELNRAQVAKVLGELLFLLEYRDEEIRLQYSSEPFSLPDNLNIIATMNTADRSVALVDVALRRRFHFVPFFPDTPPISNVLRRWLARNHPDLAWVADVVDRANAVLADRNLAIGPSHFLRPKLTHELVRLAWESSVLPFLEEHFFADPEQLARFDLERLRAEVASGPPPAP